MEIVAFDAIIAKIQTMVDHGIRLTLDLPESAIMQMAQLAECKRAGVSLSVIASPVLINSRQQEKQQQENSENAKRLATRNIRQSVWETPEEPCPDNGS